jgi:hypothetical protein
VTPTSSASLSRLPSTRELAGLCALLACAGLLFATGLHDRTNYDEGVYLASLDALRHGQQLGSNVFASQPPGFYILLRFIGLFAGRSIESIRLAMLALALAGVAGAYVVGRELAGRAGAFAAAALVVAAPPFAADAARVQADVASISLALVALALAARTFRPRATWGPVGVGVFTAAAISVKLLAVPVVVPLAVLARQRRLGGGGTAIVVGTAVALAAVLAAAYAHVLSDLLRDAIDFHLGARSGLLGPGTGTRIADYFGARTPTTWAAAAGACAAIAFRRQLALLAWFAAAVVFLLFQAPLFDHHFVLLAAAIGTAAGAALASVPRRFRAPALALAVLLAAAGWVQDYREIHRSSQPEAAEVERAAAAVRSLSRSNELVASDLPIVPYLADRREPGMLVDTSAVRFQSGSLTTKDVRTADARIFVAGREFLRYPATISGFAVVRRIGSIKILVRR